MGNIYKVLSMDADFLGAALSQSQVCVVRPLNDEMVEIVDYGGMIEKYTPDSIKVNGSYFMRKQFEFRVDVKKDSAGI
ncbi:hypothetical protein [Paenibacillus brasilensis]|uniref:Uncharacterized protein n=1 Tax=Paenibacillus brasilensis TaxID=128574 RepID=A0ABU0L545_9BACL|nr:hypothetical protein [Paenibacillus brasilensis]MDQ0496374.1 hypothetical protein [Paenibacillus brasilensis]